MLEDFEELSHYFDWTKRFEELNDYLAWTQKRHIFAAVNRFNVVSFWHSLTGKLIYKKRLENDSQIENAELFRAHDY